MLACICAPDQIHNTQTNKTSMSIISSHCHGKQHIVKANSRGGNPGYMQV